VLLSGIGSFAMISDSGVMTASFASLLSCRQADAVTEVEYLQDSAC
jgi:hypothetical protein